MTESTDPSQGRSSLVAFLRGVRPTSQQTASTETAGSERGFYRVSGRKIVPALTSGGDGYHGTTLSETSFYPDEPGIMGTSATVTAQAGPSSSSAAAAPRPLTPVGSSLRGSGSVEGDRATVMRPSRARTPVGSPGPYGRLHSPPFGSPVQPRRSPRPGDGIGRSHPSHDGSRGSRFTEDVA